MPVPPWVMSGVEYGFGVVPLVGARVRVAVLLVMIVTVLMVTATALPLLDLAGGS